MKNKYKKNKGMWAGLLIAWLIIFFIPIFKGNHPESLSDDFSIYEILITRVGLNYYGWSIFLLWVIISATIGMVAGYYIYKGLKNGR